MARSCAIAFCLGLLMAAAPLASAAFAAPACRSPDLVTAPPPDPAEMTEKDPDDRDFEFYGQSFALIVGEGNYQKAKPTLDHVETEARSLKTALEQHGFTVEAYFDLDSAALTPVITCFIQKVAAYENARVIVYFAGHGATLNLGKRQQGYVLPVDAPSDTADPEFLRTALPISQFVFWSQQLAVKHALFIFDSCFSGSIMGTRAGGEDLKPAAYVFSEVVQEPVRWYLASGTAKQTVPAESQFSKLLVQALLGQRDDADSNKDGYLTGTELTNYLMTALPTYNRDQTPVAGKANDPDLNVGDIVLKLPGQARSVSRVREPANINSNLRPVFRNIGEGQGVSEQYEVETTRRTTGPDCEPPCAAAQRQQVALLVEVPQSLPSNTVLSSPELSCVGCGGRYKVVVPPKLSADGRSASAEISTWEQAAVWRLSASVYVPTEGSKVLLVSGDSTARLVSPNALSVSALARPVAEATSAKVSQFVVDMQSSETAVRRQARADLATELKVDNGQVTSHLVRNAPTASYRYQIGLAEALADVPGGWTTTESASRDILAQVETKAADVNLKSSLKRAMANLRVSVYYEVGRSGALTQDGQLRPWNATGPKYPDFGDIRPGQILQAASEVYMRAGPAATAGAIGVLPTNACVKVIGHDVRVPATEGRGGWLQVVRTACPAA